MRHLGVIFTSVLILIPGILFSQSFITEEGHAEFTSSVPLHSFTGTSNHLRGLIDLDENLVDFYIDLETLDTGNGKRDRDMYSTLETDKFPFAEFTGSLQTPFDTETTEEQNVTVVGDFTIHGVTRSIEVEGTLQMKNNGMHLEASWILNLQNYEIEPPGILFYRVDQEIEIRIEAQLEHQDDETNET